MNSPDRVLDQVAADAAKHIILSARSKGGRKDYNWWIHVSPSHRSLIAQVRPYRRGGLLTLADDGIRYAPVTWIIGVIIFLIMVVWLSLSID